MGHSRLMATGHSDDATVTHRSDKLTGSTAGSETLGVECLARVASHIPNKGQMLQRHYGW